MIRTGHDEVVTPSPRFLTRRRLLACGIGGLGAVVGLGALGVELVDHGVLPGKSILDRLDGACDVASTDLVDASVGRVLTGTFHSRYRRREVGYSVGFPKGFRRGDDVPLVVFLHGEGGNHLSGLSELTAAQAVGLRVDGSALPPMALVTVDGGSGYWHPHPRDDPMGMVVYELVPWLRGMGLGRRPGSIGTMGVSMGGYGALLFAEVHPEMFRAVAAISPAIWTSYAQAAGVNAGAYDTASQFARYDAVTHAAALARTPVRIAAGLADPFLPGVQSLVAELPRTAEVDLTTGCHNGSFFTSQLGPSLAFLGAHLPSGHKGTPTSNRPVASRPD
jgi:S-formylglutathione hydrolase FrmB